MVNKVILLGNVGKDPEVRNLEGGAVVATMTLATNESFKNAQGEKVTQTEWHNIVVWNSLAKVVEKYVKRGDKLYVEGKIRNRSYDAQDGSKRYISEVFVTTMQMLGSAPKQPESQRPYMTDFPEEDVPTVGSGGLPF